MTRTEIIDELRKKGFTGPVSYSKPRLEEILEHVNAGTVDKLTFPRRGRPAPEPATA